MMDTITYIQPTLRAMMSSTSLSDLSGLYCKMKLITLSTKGRLGYLGKSALSFIVRFELKFSQIYKQFVLHK
jgi:hypothetical protein